MAETVASMAGDAKVEAGKAVAERVASMAGDAKVEAGKAVGVMVEVGGVGRREEEVLWVMGVKVAEVLVMVEAAKGAAALEEEMVLSVSAEAMVVKVGRVRVEAVMAAGDASSRGPCVPIAGSGALAMKAAVRVAEVREMRRVAAAKAEVEMDVAKLEEVAQEAAV